MLCGFLNRWKCFVFYDKLGIFLSILSLLILLVFIFTSINQSIWFDEAWTLTVVNDSFSGMVGAVAGDVHPPLYYIILKSVFSLFEAFKIPFNEIIIGKLVSLFPLILLQLFSFFKLRKDYGWLSAGIFSMAIITMPQMMYYGIEIRMYTWAMFFVTMSFYYAYKITKEPQNKINWGLITLFAVLSAYTHYFAVISCFVIFTFLLIWIILKKQNQIKYWLISAILGILLYLPWINILTNQFTDKGGTLSFIPPITVGHVLNQLKFIICSRSRKCILNCFRIGSFDYYYFFISLCAYKKGG